MSIFLPAPYPNRTSDLRITSATLYHLAKGARDGWNLEEETYL